MEKSVYEKLSEKIMVPQSKYIPKLFAMLVDEKEAEILLALPGSPEEMAEKFSMPLEEMKAKLALFFYKGLAFKSVKPDHVKYRMDRDLVQFHDATILWPEAPRPYFEMWQRFMEEEWPAYAKMVESVVPRPFTRIIPIEKSLAPRSSVLDSESARKMIEESDNIAVTKCTCRLIAGKCDRPIEVCLQVGRAASYNIERGTGRKVDREEAIRILEESEKAGLIHVTMNRSEDTHFISLLSG